MTTIVIASRNVHKLKEIDRILSGIALSTQSLVDFPEIPEIEETSDTFAGNALIKAKTVFEHTGNWALSDDSGLEVDALDGAPGVYSARYSGPAKDPAENNKKLLAALANVSEQNRGGQFRCVVAIVGPGVSEVVEGIIRGSITRELLGKDGFGYDPLFIPEGYTCTFAEMTPTEKNSISHRAIAFLKAKERLEVLFKNI